mgnify:CR=1 FL=1
MREINKILTIAKFTFKEIIKSNILVNIFFLGLGLLLVTYVAYSFTYGEPARIALDFGLGTLSLSSVGIAIFIGSGILAKEIDSRTVYMIISRPVPRYCFILGKVMGLILVLIVNVLLLSTLTLSAYFFIGGEFAPILMWSILFILFEAIIALLVVSLLSLISSQTIAVILSMIVYVLGHAIDGVKLTSMIAKNKVLESIIDVYHFFLPGYYKLNLKEHVIYKQNIELDYLVNNTFYVLFYSLFLITLCVLTFNKKNLD